MRRRQGIQSAGRGTQAAGTSQGSCSAKDQMLKSNDWKDPGDPSGGPNKQKALDEPFMEGHSKKGNRSRKILTSPLYVPLSIPVSLFLTLLLLRLMVHVP